jgi:hexosaminidase
VDGSAPTTASPAYAAPFTVPLGTTVRAATYTVDGEPLAAARSFSLAPEALLTRNSAELDACPDGAMGLRVPLSPDVTATAPVFNVNLFDACWVYPKARLDGVTRIEVAAARLPRNYGLAHDIDKVMSHPASTPFGELVIRAGSCAGPVLASLPLPDPKAGGDVHLPLDAAIKPQAGEQDLCMIFTAPIDGPLYAINTVQLVQARDAR